MNTTPTGRIDREGDRHTLVITRTFRAPIEDVWASVTEPERLARWIGTWTGDPESGEVLFQMTAEGQEPPGDEMKIRECVPPRRLALSSRVGEEFWLLELDLEEADGVTTLTFSQPEIDPAAAENIGPGWEYYLDRLVAAMTGGDVGAIDFDRDYYPAMQEHYRG
jgi:uncharacterized protein YndB with AHSA1/START domain